MLEYIVMKILILGVLIGVVAVVGSLALRGRNSSQDAVSPGPSGDNRFVIAVLSQEVLVKMAAEEDFKKIEKEGEAAEGAEIQISKSGRASVLYPNGTIFNLESGTNLLIKSLNGDGEQSRLRLIVGGVWSKIKNILGKGDYYEVETENMVASVRGTEFRVQFANGVSTIEVFENTVSVQAIDPKTGEPIEGGFIELFAGEKALIDSANLPSKNKPLKKLTASTSPKPSPQATPRPSVAPTPTPVSTSSPQVTPASIQTLSTPKPTPTPTPAPKPIITSVTPSKIQQAFNQEVQFAINGQNLTGSKAVFLNKINLQFFVVDSFTIFATLGPNIGPGTYDVSVTAASGETLTLYRALEVQVAQ